MIPYRPGIMRIPGARNRAQAMNDGFGEVPSLLDSLVFYPVWVGSQCVDIISGAVLTNSSIPVMPTSVSPYGEVAGRYVAASLNYLSCPKIEGGMSLSIITWSYPSVLDRYQPIIAKTSAMGFHEYALYYSNVGKPTFAVGNGITSSNVALPLACRIGWHMMCGVIDLSSSTISITRDGLTPVTGAIDPYAPAENGLSIGCWGDFLGTEGRHFNGSIGSCLIWRRVLSYREQQAYYANCQGINLSQYF